MTRKMDRRAMLASTGLAALIAKQANAQGFGADQSTEAVIATGFRAREFQEPLPETQADLGSMFHVLSSLAQKGEYPLSFRHGKYETVEEFQEIARSKILELLAYRPPIVEPKAQILERINCEGYVREKILFATSPTTIVPAYVLIPNNLKEPAPAVVDLHSHGGMFLFGKEKVIDLAPNHPAMVTYHEKNYSGRPTATELVKRGFVVISIDAFGFGERRIILDTDRHKGADRSKYSLEDVQYLNQQCRNKESTIAKSMVFAGLTWPGIVAWDDMRTVDYLCTRPEVDTSRIGCLGISMGGYRATYLMALDDRVKAGCVVGFMSTVLPMLKAHIDTHSWVHFLPGLHQFLDLPDVASLAMPRALMVQQCSQDRLFTIEGMRDSVSQIKAAYEKAGTPSTFSARFYDAPHQFTLPMQEDAIAWLQKNLH